MVKRCLVAVVLLLLVTTIFTGCFYDIYAVKEIESEKETVNILTKDVSKELCVWIPTYGIRYHSKASCSNMNQPSFVTKQKAVSLGYTPCKKCW